MLSGLRGIALALAVGATLPYADNQANAQQPPLQLNPPANAPPPLLAPSQGPAPIIPGQKLPVIGPIIQQVKEAAGYTREFSDLDTALKKLEQDLEKEYKGYKEGRPAKNIIETLKKVDEVLKKSDGSEMITDRELAKNLSILNRDIKHIVNRNWQAKIVANNYQSVEGIEDDLNLARLYESVLDRINYKVASYVPLSRESYVVGAPFLNAFSEAQAKELKTILDLDKQGLLELKKRMGKRFAIMTYAHHNLFANSVGISVNSNGKSPLLVKNLVNSGLDFTDESIELIKQIKISKGAEKELAVDKLITLFNFTRPERANEVYQELAGISNQVIDGEMTDKELLKILSASINGYEAIDLDLDKEDLKPVELVANSSFESADILSKDIRNLASKQSLNPEQTNFLAQMNLDLQYEDDEDYYYCDVDEKLMKLERQKKRVDKRFNKVSRDAWGATNVEGIALNNEIATLKQVEEYLLKPDTRNPFYESIGQILKYADGANGIHALRMDRYQKQFELERAKLEDGEETEEFQKFKEDTYDEIYREAGKAAAFKLRLLTALENPFVQSVMRRNLLDHAFKYFNYNYSGLERSEEGKTRSKAYFMYQSHLDSVAIETRLMLERMAELRQSKPLSYEKQLKFMKSLFDKVPFLEGNHNVIEILDPYGKSLSNMDSKPPLLQKVQDKYLVDEKEARFFQLVYPESYLEEDLVDFGTLATAKEIGDEVFSSKFFHLVNDTRQLKTERLKD